MQSAMPRRRLFGAGVGLLALICSGATLAYMQMTVSCVNCNRVVRDRVSPRR